MAILIGYSYFTSSYYLCRLIGQFSLPARKTIFHISVEELRIHSWIKWFYVTHKLRYKLYVSPLLYYWSHNLLNKCHVSHISLRILNNLNNSTYKNYYFRDMAAWWRCRRQERKYWIWSYLIPFEPTRLNTLSYFYW